MTAKSSKGLLNAIESGELLMEIVRATSSTNPMASDLYEVVMTIGDRQFARLGVWKSSAGGIVGDGAPHVHFDGRTVHVDSGDGMNGSFDIDCDFENEAGEIAAALEDRLIAEYEEIEVEIATS